MTKNAKAEFPPSPGPGPAVAGGEPGLLTISEVSRRTGIPAAGLRNWEQRYGVPRPRRSASGQRRYTEADCDLLTDVLRRRAAGLSLAAAVAAASGAGPAGGETSIFAGLRRRHPQLRVHVINQRILLALTHAIEDQCCASAQRPVLIGSFQRRRHYAAARPRWDDLAASAEHTVVFADFPRPRQRPGPLAEIPLPAGSPQRREWTLVCDAPDLPACVAGWERPGQDDGPQAERIFEAVWSVDPQVVRSAARIGAHLAGAALPGLPALLAGRLGGPASPCSPDLRRAGELLERTVDYLAR